MNRLPTFSQRPLLNRFVYLTLIVAAVLIAFVVLGFVIKVVLFAAVVAALALGVLFVINLFRRRTTALPPPR